MAKQLNVSLAFSADTSKAKAQLQDLQRQLTNLTNSTGSIANSQRMGITKQLHEASMAAAQLKVQLQDATNVNTGKLDLVKFNQSLKASGMDLQQYKNQLMALGPAGAQAFSGLAAAVTNAEAPIFRVSNRVRELGTVLKNTVRWQISSSMLHGFMGAIQGAYGYAKDLNESLNNIRIVTGQSTDQMAKFAKEANKAAKALSSTTTEYTDAALIYYQQGLSGEQVKERAETTLKMANVSRQSAETVSQQMTSVWNNFYDGGKSLEYYSDVMVALGAATASSSDEIATGLEKFSAVSNTVGLSYEYAAAALATVTAQTRQSADTVGTAFRTLFTRLEGLNLGETAEDGTTLNKYSEALYKVGVNIKDQQGQLKDMDQILDELGAKWQTIGKEQQVALAQTVGGARQYATLIALMDNWDFFQKNLGTAKGAEGSLQEQADIYAESWEAARDRVTASLEKIYGELLNDKFFISLNNGFAGFLDIIGNVMDGLGGLKGVLLTIGTILISVYQKQLADGLKNLTATIYSWTAAGKKQINDLRNSASEALKSMTGANIGKLYENQAIVQEKYLANIRLMSEEDQKRAKILMEQHGALAQQVIDTAKIIEEQQKQVNVKSRSVPGSQRQDVQNIGRIVTQGTALGHFMESSLGFSDDQLKNTDGFNQFVSQIQNLKQNLSLTDIKNQFGKDAQDIFKKLFNELDKGTLTATKAKNALNKLIQVKNNAEEEAAEFAGRTENETKEIEEFLQACEKLGITIGKNIGHQVNFANSTEQLSTAFQSSAQKMLYWQDKAVLFAQNLSQLGMVLSSVTSLAKTWSNEDISIGDKLLQSITTLSFAFPMLIGFMKTIVEMQKVKNFYNKADNALLAAQIAEVRILNQLKKDNVNIDKKEILLTKAQIVWNKILLAVSGSALGATLALVAVLGGAIALVALAINKYKEWQKSTPEGKLETATKETEKATQAAKDAAGAYDELVNKINNIDTAIDKLSELTKGTTEYKKALSEANTEVLDLISKYDLMPEKNDYIIKDGLITLTETGKMKVKAAEWENVSDTISIERSSRAKQAYFANEVEYGKYDNFNYYDSDTGQYLSSIHQDDFEKLANYAVDNVITTADDLEKIFNNFEYDLVGVSAKEYAEYLYNDPQFASLIEAIRENTIAIENTMSIATGEILSDEVQFNRRDIVDQALITEIVSEKAASYYLQYMDDADFKKNLSPEDWKNYADSVKGLEFDGANLTSTDEKGNKVILNHADYIDNVMSLKASQLAETKATNEFLLGVLDEEISSRRNNLSKDEKNQIFQNAEQAEANKYGLDLAGWKAYQEYLKKEFPELNKLIAEHNDISIEATSSILEWAEDAGKLVEVLEENEEALSNTDDIINYRKALIATAEAVSNLLNTTVDSDFVEQNMVLIKEALNGSEDAVIELKRLYAEAELIKQGVSADAATALSSSIMGVLQDTEIGAIDLLSPTYEQLYQDLINFAELMGWGADTAVTKFKDMFNLDLSDMLVYDTIPFKGHSIETVGNVSNIIDDDTGNTIASVSSDLLASYEIDGAYKIPHFGKKGETKMPAKGSSSFTGFVAANPSTKNKNSSNSSKSKKKASDEIDRYHVVKEQLEDIEQELDRISKAKERAFGGDKLKLMDDEIAKTQELLDKEQEYFDQINANYGPDRAILENKYGAKFDVNGALLNYDSIMNAQINAFNSSLSDEAEENYNNFKELIDKYEETDDLLAEQRQKLIDLQNELFDLMLEKLEYEVTLKIDVNEDANKYLDFLMEMNGDGMDHALDNIDALGEKIANGMEDIETYTNGLNNMFKNRGYKGNVVEDLQSGKVTPEELAEMYDLTEAEVDLMREYMGNIMDITKEIQNMRKEITDQLIDAMEEINEKFDEQIDKINRAAEGMQHYRDIIDLVGQDVLGISDEMVEMFSEKQLNNSIANVSATRTKMLENEREYNEAVAELERLKDTGASEFAIEEQERVVEAAREHLYDSTDEFNSAWKDALEQAREHFDLTIEQITSAFEEAMSGIYGNLEALQDAYDRQSEINERYLEDYEKIYELSKLNRDIGNSIDNTDNIRAKQELMKLQEEINALEESGAEISKYDLDFLRQKYELRLAEIALEEAQNAKSQVRMTRDSEGNWNYTYTANEENISKAEQNYEDALYKTQQLTTDYIKDLENRIFQLNTDLVNALSNIDPNDAEGRQRIYDYYMGQNAYLTSQLNNALGNNADIYNQDWINYSNATGYKISDNEKWMDSFNETTLSMLTGFSTLGDYQTAFRDNSLSMYNGINEAAATFAKNTAEVMEIAGASIENFAKDAQDAFLNPETGFVAVTNQATDSIKDIDTEAKTAFDSILLKLQQFNKDYDKQIQETIKINNSLIESLNNLIAKEAEAKKSSGGSSSNNTTNNNPGTTSTVDEPAPEKEIWYNPIKSGSEYIEGNCIYQNYIQKSSWGRTRPADRKLVRVISGGGRAQSGAAGLSGGIGSQHSMVLMDTGGYTGAWGTTAGKLAMLHEKELVLNKQDTENILQSVNLVRQISDWISGRVNAMQYGSMLSAFGLPGDNKNVLEQMVTIHAEFPNANNRAEIEAAFDNLVNRAAQYAYRK